MFPVQDLKGLGYEKGKPVGLVGVTELSDAQKKQLKEQQEVRPEGGAGSTAAGADCPSSLWCSDQQSAERLLGRLVPHQYHANPSV